MNNTQNNGQIYRLSQKIKGMLLSQAFVELRREGLQLRVNLIDGETITPNPANQLNERINVNVLNGIVTSTWVG